MYNRYIPQPDGSYRRNRMQEPMRHPPAPKPTVEDECIPPPPPDCAPPPKPTFCPKQSGNMDSFLRQLLPKDFDTGDLIVVLLLLLMAGDSQDGRNNALLTLALYFLM